MTFIIFLCAAMGSKASVFSILLGALFGAVTLFMNLCKIKALAKGPMHLTVMIVNSSMIIPALSSALDADWNGYEKLCLKIRNDAHKYRNHDKETDIYAAATFFPKTVPHATAWIKTALPRLLNRR